MNEKEIIRYLYDEGYIDFTRDENEELTLHANTTGKGLIEIFRAGYGKSQKEFAEAVKNSESRILDLSILEANKDLTVTEAVEKSLDIIKEEFGEFNHVDKK